jgi:hypothetical protein
MLGQDKRPRLPHPFCDELCFWEERITSCNSQEVFNSSEEFGNVSLSWTRINPIRALEPS